MKKVVMLLIDSLAPHQLEEALAHRSVPALQFLRAHATYAGKATTVYPTMTATVDSSLLTGTYPDEHRVPGLVWFDEAEKRLVNYLNGITCVAWTGLRRCALNNLRELNERHLSANVETIYEALHARGRTAASINALVHRGAARHELTLPRPFRWLTGIGSSGRLHVSGPDTLVMGCLSRNTWQKHIPPHFYWPWRAYGVNDGYSVQAASRLLQAGKQPDFMLLYFPDHDHAMHRKNPAHMRDAMLQLDRHLQQLFAAFGGDWRQAMTDTTWILVSDHGQSQIARQAIGQIDLDALLRPLNLRVMPISACADDRYDLAVANNERMAYVYPLRAEVAESVCQQLGKEARFDLVAWKDGRTVRVLQPGSGWTCSFSKTWETNASTERSVRVDQYGMNWYVEGDWRVLDLQEERGTLYYGEYPDALARIYGALFAHDQPVILVNARPRYEIRTAMYPSHKNGGAHGGLHRSESEVPLWLTGVDDVSWLPANPRIVDLKAMILRLLEAN